ncbi:MAG: hypothetical protein ACI4UE_00235 [Candidatus Scatovivens sp.]
MKKYFLFIFIIILIVIAICYSINVNNNKTEKINNSVTINDIDNISYVMLKEETEGGYIYYKTENKELIQEIIEALNNIEIGEKVDVMFSDNGQYYIIEYYDGTTLTYYFQNNYYNKDNVNYRTYNYEELRKIKIPEEIVNN